MEMKRKKKKKKKPRTWTLAQIQKALDSVRRVYSFPSENQFVYFLRVLKMTKDVQVIRKKGK